MSTTTTALPPHAAEATPLQPGAGTRRTRSLGSYIALDTQQTREVVSLQRPDGSTLVVDYQLGTLSDGRLVAHLAPDEPPENAQIVCELYLADDTKGRCRAVTREDFDLTRHATPPPSGADAPTAVDAVKDAEGHVYRIRELPDARDDGRAALDALPRARPRVRLRRRVVPRCRRRRRSLRAGANPHRPGAHPLRQEPLHPTAAGGVRAPDRQPDRAQPRAPRSGPTRAACWRAEHERDRARAADGSSATAAATRPARRAGWRAASA